MISDVAIRQPRHRGAILAARVIESQLATGIRTARAFSYRLSYKPNMNGAYTRSGVASLSPIGGSPFPVCRFLCTYADRALAVLSYNRSGEFHSAVSVILRVANTTPAS